MLEELEKQLDCVLKILRTRLRDVSSTDGGGLSCDTALFPPVELCRLGSQVAILYLCRAEANLDMFGGCTLPGAFTPS